MPVTEAADSRDARATVLRAIDDGHVGTSPPRRRRPKVFVAWIVGTLLVACVAGWLVARTSGQRLPGQAITGGLPGDEVAQKLAEARQLLGVNPQQAIIRYQQVRELDPNNAEALTYMGWLIAQSGTSTAAAGAEFLRGAIKIDPTYADPHCFLAITSADFLQPPDLDTARSEAQACLDNNPPAQMVQLVQSFISRLDANTTTTSP